MDLKIEPLSNPVLDRLRPHFKRSYTHGSIKISPPGSVYNTSFQDNLSRILSFQVREDDVWVITFPKAGTTWTQEMVWLIVHDLDYEGAKVKGIEDRFPFIECSSMVIQNVENPVRDTITLAENSPPPRCIKSHLHKQILPTALWERKPKIVYVYRDPKDVAVSYYYHNCLLKGYSGTKELFFEAFLEGVVMFGPFWEHVLDFWKLRHEPYVLFNTFEEMKQDLPGVIRRTSEFLGKRLSEDDVTRLAKHLSFSSMKQNSTVNKISLTLSWESLQLSSIPGLQFMRKGESGSWRQEMSPDMAKRFDEWARKKIAGTDFPYTYSDQ